MTLTVGRMKNTASTAPDVLGAWRKAPTSLSPSLQARSSEATGFPLPFQNLSNCSWDSSTPSPQLPFWRCCLLFLLQVLSFSPRKYLSSHYFNHASRALVGRPWRGISSGFCLLCQENKQACLTYLCFPSRWTPRSKHGVDLPSAPWTFRVFKPGGLPFSTAGVGQVVLSGVPQSTCSSCQRRSPSWAQGSLESRKHSAFLQQQPGPVIV